MSRNITKMVLSGILLVVATSGCSTDLLSGSGREPAIPDDPPPVSSYVGLLYPLSPYMWNGEDLRLYWNAQSTLASQCVADFGLTYQPELASGPVSSDSVVVAQRYGVIDRASALTYGYGASPEESGEGIGESYLADSHDPQVDEALSGQAPGGGTSRLTAPGGRALPEGGCMSEADRRLSGPEMGIEQATHALVIQGLSETRQQMLEDSRVRAAEARFGQCMRSRGYPKLRHIDDRDDSVMGDIEAQRAAAVATAECAQQVNLAGIAHAVDSAYQDRFVAQHETALREGLAARQKMLERAKEVLG